LLPPLQSLLKHQKEFHSVVVVGCFHTVAAAAVVVVAVALPVSRVTAAADLWGYRRGPWVESELDAADLSY
jgi:hypothetical protein